MDNSVAVALATGNINAKRSKTMDMRFFWLVDRVKQGHFTVEHIPGIWNIADHFTKALPRAKFYQLLPFITVNIDSEDSDDYVSKRDVKRVCCVYNIRHAISPLSSLPIE
jgi:hypothetical protein